MITKYSQRQKPLRPSLLWLTRPLKPLRMQIKCLILLNKPSSALMAKISSSKTTRLLHLLSSPNYKKNSRATKLSSRLKISKLSYLLLKLKAAPQCWSRKHTRMCWQKQTTMTKKQSSSIYSTLSLSLSSNCSIQMEMLSFRKLNTRASSIPSTRTKKIASISTTNSQQSMQVKMSLSLNSKLLSLRKSLLQIKLKNTTPKKMEKLLENAHFSSLLRTIETTVSHRISYSISLIWMLIRLWNSLKSKQL